jgi:hypothetical protein
VRVGNMRIRTLMQACIGALLWLSMVAAQPVVISIGPFSPTFACVADTAAAQSLVTHVGVCVRVEMLLFDIGVPTYHSLVVRGPGDLDDGKYGLQLYQDDQCSNNSTTRGFDGPGDSCNSVFPAVVFSSFEVEKDTDTARLLGWRVGVSTGPSVWLIVVCVLGALLASAAVLVVVLALKLRRRHKPDRLLNSQA